MPSATPTRLTPRRKPRQARSTVTLHAIFEATIQVLLSDGPERLTTTRVAERAGVSVGTLYQYFPHKQALFYGLNEHYLDALAATIERTCQTLRGAPIDRMIEVLVGTYWDAKMERPDITRVLYRSVVDLDNAPLIEAFTRRVDAASAAMFGSAADAVLPDLAIVNLTLLNTIFGTVRSVCERDLPDDAARAVQGQVIVMCRAYLDRLRTDGRE
ncbi:TetR/AcrR family transcriptional regulator [Burkholderia sp. Ac-20379]|uniref:TetR/AcrR family transcriptional regulator n=1 Tax=Burkholderia sp. Ac-20379 TaxID=2703900 RepID=UPI001980D1F4|nr:TetR/AcrR family transcriptional regulator [Burkholderia sp. Ac-20379]MBN3725453.1 TetR/AcrR family transcriptional regulator [Burkholderia sp. Ac-20379]